MINIAGLDKAAVLATLYDNAKSKGVAFTTPRGPSR
jgi:hypothetical protein